MTHFAHLFGPDTLDVMSHALQEAMDECNATPGGEFNVAMAHRIMAAAAAGERDLDALKRAALGHRPSKSAA